MGDCETKICNFDAVQLKKTCDVLGIAHGQVARLLKTHGGDVCLALQSVVKTSLWDKYEVVDFLGFGRYGCCLLLQERGSRSDLFAAKLTTDSFAPYEHEIFRRFYRKGLAPKPIEFVEATISSGSVKKQRIAAYITVMQEVAAVLTSMLARRQTPMTLRAISSKLIDLHKRLLRAKVCHGDFHTDNIAVTRDGRLLCIDMGMSLAGQSDGPFDIAQLIRTLHPSYLHGVCQDARKKARKIADAIEMQCYHKMVSKDELRDQRELVETLRSCTDKRLRANASSIRKSLARYAHETYPDLFKTQDTSQLDVERIFHGLGDEHLKRLDRQYKAFAS